MRKLALVGTVIGFLFQTAPAFALVRLVASCATSDGKYQLSIVDNQGIGPVRTSHFGADIRNAEGETVGTYRLVFVPSNGSISFGHPSYYDAETRGQRFNFAFPSTNTPYAVRAYLNDGTLISYGHRFTPGEASLSCTTH